MKEQIEEMAKIICGDYNGGVCGLDENSCNYNCEWREIAKHLYNAGYRKQKEGEWIERIEKPSWLEDDVEVYYNCSVCGTSHFSIISPYCPNCGAKMKGGSE